MRVVRVMLETLLRMGDGELRRRLVKVYKKIILQMLKKVNKDLRRGKSLKDMNEKVIM